MTNKQAKPVAEIQSTGNLDSQYDFNINDINFVPNHNIVSFAVHNNKSLGKENIGLGKQDAKLTNQTFNPKFSNVSFPEIMNYYENLVTTSQWDVRENGDYETIILGRSNYFYNCIKYNWKQTGNFIDDFDKTLKEDYEEKEESDEEKALKKGKTIKSKKNTQNPREFLTDVISYQIENNLSKSYIDLKTSLENKNKDIFVNFERNLFRDNRRKVGEMIFALNKINLISYDIKTNDVVNTITISGVRNGLIFKDEQKLGITIIGSNIEDEIVEKPVSNMFENMGSDVNENNILIQGEYMATQLIKELELTYQGSITILFNQDVEIGDYVTLIDDSASTYGTFKVMSFEHVLDKRGMITILKVSAAFDLRDPVLDTFSSSISYQLMDEFRKQLAGDIDGSDNYVINKVFAYYLKYITHAVKYTNFRWINFNENGTINYKDNPMNQLIFSPSVIPIRFYPMTRKGIVQIPVSLEKAFTFHDNVYKEYFSALKFFVNYKIHHYLLNFGRSLVKVLNYVGDIIAGTFTFNLNELIKPHVGNIENKAEKALIGDVTVEDSEFLNTNKGSYNPYNNTSKSILGRDYDLTIAFFNTQLQSTMNLNNNSIIKSTGRAKEAIDFKEKIVREKILETFDATFMVEIYDGFNNDKVLKDYSFRNYVYNITPRNYTNNIVGRLFNNQHGSEFGTVFYNKRNITIKENKIIKSGVIEKIKYKDDKENLIKQEVERNYIETTIDISDFSFEIKYLKIYWFHNFYGASDYEVNDIEIRKQFINSIFQRMREQNRTDTGCILMGDCNLEIINYNSDVIKHTGDSWANNYVYSIPEKYKDFKSMITNATTIDTKGETKNIFDNIVIDGNLAKEKNLEHFYFSEFNYSEDRKREVSDHIPVYIGIKVN